jgi:hypothetical protein
MAEKRLTTATLVVQYQSKSDQDSFIKAEIDPEYHQESSFNPGEPVYFRVFANCAYDMYLSDVNAGVASAGSGVHAVEEDLVSFIQTKELSTAYPYSGGWSFSWHGVPRVDGVNISTPQAPESNKTGYKIVTDGDVNKIVAAGKVNFNSNFSRFRLTPGSSAEGYAIIVLIVERA